MDDMVRLIDMLKASRKVAEEIEAAELPDYLISMALAEAEHQLGERCKAPSDRSFHEALTLGPEIRKFRTTVSKFRKFPSGYNDGLEISAY